MDLVTNLRCHAANQGEKLALVDGERRWSFAELWADAARFANALIGLGCEPGARVAVVTANRAEHVVALYGIAAAGAVAVPLPARMPGEQLARTIADAGGEFVVWGGAAGAVPAELDGVVAVERRIGLDGVGGTGPAFDELLAGASAADPGIPIAAGDDLVVLYSSGTTGTPKGMVLSHGCRVAYALGFSVEFGVGRDDVFGMLTPIYHNGAQMWLHSVIYAGGTVALLGGVEDLVGAGPAGGGPPVTVTFAIPAQLRELAELAGATDRAPLTAVTGTMPVTAALKREVLEALPWCRLYEAYGLTEAGVLTILRPDEQLDHGDSIGRPFVDCELRLADLGSGEPADEGELLATGPCLMSGYHGRDDLNAGSFAGAFFKTGDIARRDADGYLHLLDRKDDLIVTGGVNVFARDVEEVLAAHPAVAAACAVGVPDERWGEAVTAAVVPREPFDAEALVDYCRGRLSPPQVPKRIVPIDRLPRNEQGKVLRREVRALAAELAEVG